MKLIRVSYPQIPKLGHLALTIGNFDGVHLGHQALLAALSAAQARRGSAVGLLTFEPPSRLFFAHREPPPRLMSLSEKYLELSQYGLDYLICLRFTAELASLSPETFVDEVLVGCFGLQAIVVGDDFRFGAKRRGDFTLLKQLGEQYGYESIQVPGICQQNERISSSRIRDTLMAGEIELANQLLGHPYSLSGCVVHGDGRGKELGYPTINLRLHRTHLPLSGIFFVRVEGVSDQPWPGVASIGTKPTFGGTETCVEVYLLNFSGDLYGRRCQVVFLHKLRDQQIFSDLAGLIQTIKNDVQAATEYFQEVGCLS